MSITNYHTINGTVLGQSTSSSRRDFLVDASSSVVATVSSTSELENVYRYRPFGTMLQSSGLAPDIRWLWTGGTGSRNESTPYAEQYNRHRHYALRLGRWNSVDPLWPEELAFAYCESNPTTKIDPSGLHVGIVKLLGKEKEVNKITGTIQLPDRIYVPHIDDNVLFYIGTEDAVVTPIEGGLSLSMRNAQGRTQTCAFRAFLNPPHRESPILAGLTCGMAVTVTLELKPKETILTIPQFGVKLVGPAKKPRPPKVLFTTTYFSANEPTQHTEGWWVNMWIRLKGAKSGVRWNLTTAERVRHDPVYNPVEVGALTTTSSYFSAVLNGGTDKCGCGPIDIGHGNVGAG